MAATTIANLFPPSVWVEALVERMATYPSLINRGAIMRDERLDAAASGPGTSANIPFFKDSTDTADEIQVEGTGPTINNVTTGTQIAPVLNRVSTFGAQALSGAVSGTDPLQHAIDQIVSRRMKQRQTTMLSILDGIFSEGTASTAMLACSNASFEEAIASQDSGDLIDSDFISDTLALMGENQDLLQNGFIAMHPQIHANLKKQDKTNFDRDSSLGFMVNFYQGIPVILSSSLRRAGTTDGYVYSTYFVSEGAFAGGDKAQVSGTEDEIAGTPESVASITKKGDAHVNSCTFYDRTRFLLQPFGVAFTIGSISGQSATNAELEDKTDWSLVASSADRVGIAAAFTNG